MCDPTQIKIINAAEFNPVNLDESEYEMEQVDVSGQKVWELESQQSLKDAEGKIIPESCQTFYGAHVYHIAGDKEQIKNSTVH